MLAPGQSIDVTLRFQNAGEVTVPAQVATPSRPLPRGDAFNFGDEGGTSSEGTQGAGTGSGG